MNTMKDQLLWHIYNNALSKAADLAGEYTQAKAGEKEAIIAGLEFEQWLTETCQRPNKNGIRSPVPSVRGAR